MIILMDRTCKQDEQGNRFYLRNYTDLLKHQKYSVLHFWLKGSRRVLYLGTIEHSTGILHTQHVDIPDSIFTALGIKNVCVHKENIEEIYFVHENDK